MESRARGATTTQGSERHQLNRVSRLVVLALWAAALVVAGATTTLKNQTDTTATGVVIQFSEAVRITSYDKSVFPTQSPASGEAESFTFSGGSLAAGGAFEVTWSPSSAKLRSTKWITSGSAIATSTASIPTTYEEIMAQIAHYPGPDEPLYVPAEGEAIWLTDLEGHADIYDNDSIRVNYATGFDKNQITRIEVYRNGIKMRFLPDKLDVLTNEQMKTFDGNPAERTPKSSHTDHAIFGYEYEFNLFKSSGTNVTVIATAVKSPIHLEFDEVWVMLDGNWPLSLEHLSDAELDAFLTRLKRDGFTGIQIDFATFADSPTASTAWTLDSSDPKTGPYGVRTGSIAEFGRLLSAVGEAGLAAHIANQTWISMKYPRDRFVYSADIEPRNLGEYLESYLTIWRQYIPVFEQCHVALLTPFREMDGIINRTEEIRSFYDKLAVGFSGRLGCETNTANYLRWVSPSQRGRSFAQMAPSFWDWCDPQGRPLVNELDVWSPPLSPTKDQRYSQMIISYVQFLAPALDYYGTHYPRNPLMYGQLGVFDIDGVATGDWLSVIQPRVFDDQETADVWGAYLIGVKLQGIQSVCVWSIPLGDSWSNHVPGDIMINLDSGTYRVITSMIGTATTP